VVSMQDRERRRPKKIFWRFIWVTQDSVRHPCARPRDLAGIRVSFDFKNQGSCCRTLSHFYDPSNTTMMFRSSSLALLALLASFTSGYQPSNPRSQKQPARAAAAVATAALSVLLSTSTLPALASDTAAQISLQQIPPSSISIEIGDLPVIGNVLSGTYTKVPDGSISKPSLVIKSPKDKVKAIQSLATGGHLEFDVGGKLSTHLDVDVASDQAGTAKILVESSLIPKLPFKNRASSVIGTPSGGKESAWNIVTNLGNGESYYYNLKTGVTQFERPKGI